MMASFNPSIEQQCEILNLLDQSGLNSIECGHVGLNNEDDIIRKLNCFKITKPVLLSDTKPDNINKAIELLQAIDRPSQLHIFSLANINKEDLRQTLKILEETLSYTCQSHSNVQWTGFDGNRCPWFEYTEQVKCAIASGVSIVSYPDSLGVSQPNEFRRSLTDLKSIAEETILAVHCHDDLGFALDNSLLAMELGIQQIECSLLGVGARKGNCDLGKIIRQSAADDFSQSKMDKIREAEEYVGKLISE